MRKTVILSLMLLLGFAALAQTQINDSEVNTPKSELLTGDESVTFSDLGFNLGYDVIVNDIEITFASDMEVKPEYGFNIEDNKLIFKPSDKLIKFVSGLKPNTLIQPAISCSEGGFDYNFNTVTITRGTIAGATCTKVNTFMNISYCSNGEWIPYDTILWSTRIIDGICPKVPRI